MARHQCSVMIRRQVDEVFSFVMDPVHNRHWQSGVIETRWRGGAMQPGERVTELRELAGHRVEATLELVAVDVPRRSDVRIHCGLLPGAAGYRFDPVGDATRFTVEIEVAPRGPLRFAARMLTCVAAAEVSASCRRLKTLLEQPAAVAA